MVAVGAEIVRRRCRLDVMVGTWAIPAGALLGFAVCAGMPRRAAQVYWADTMDQSVNKANLDGSGVEAGLRSAQRGRDGRGRVICQ